MAALVVTAYLAGDNPRAQSGHSGDEVRWEQARRLIVDAIDRDGTFLDVGCASGHLMETVQVWAAADGFALEPYGLDISPKLAELARTRLPNWRDRIWVGNALAWTTPRRFDFVRAGLEYVPPPRRPDLVRRLLAEACEPGGRLILGVRNESRDAEPLEHEVAAWGFEIAGRSERPHSDPRVVRRAFWIDAA